MEGALIFSYIRRLGPFLGFKILNFIFLGGGGLKNEILGCEEFVDIYWDHHKT